MQLDVVADRPAAQRVEERLQRRALGVEPQLVAEVEHPQVGEHLALGGQQRGVEAAAGPERLDVVGDLARQEPLGVTAGQRQFSPLRAVKKAALLVDHPEWFDLNFRFSHA